jgi:hypothetical protein
MVEQINNRTPFMINNPISAQSQKRIEPEIAGLIAGFLGSIPFLAVMVLVPVTLFMRLMQLAMPFMPQINLFGWMLHVVVNMFWGFLFVVMIEKFQVQRIYLAAVAWSMLLVALVLIAVPLVGLQVSSTLVIVETAAYLNFATVLWAVYLMLAKKE